MASFRTKPTDSARMCVLLNFARGLLHAALVLSCFSNCFAQQLPVDETQANDDSLQYFESKIRPLLVKHCYACHSKESKELQGGFRVDTRHGLIDGGDSGPAITPGDAKNSLLISALRHESLEMPPDQQLGQDIIAAFERWINSGAKSPADAAPSSTKNRDRINWDQARQFWSFQPRKQQVVPVVGIAAKVSIEQDGNEHVTASNNQALHDSLTLAAAQWVRHPVDAFIVAQHARAKLTPASEAARHTWLRRVYFDLTGLPPDAEDVYQFMQNESPDAHERVVDRLLASPTYGERWGRHWLDLARYADSNGADENHAYPVAWRYRDYVINAFNGDLPYDRFVLEQLAGDLLVSASDEERAELLTATGFLVLGPKMLAEQDKPKLVADLVDEQLDTFGKVFLGLSLGCARCHDHKFDPITAEDYYSLAGVFHSTKSMEHLEFVSQWNERELPNSVVSQAITEHAQQLEPAERELKNSELAVRDRDFELQLGRLLSALIRSSRSDHQAVTNPIEGQTVNATTDNPEVEKIVTRLSSLPAENRSGVLRIWYALRDTPRDKFSLAAEELWIQLAKERENARATRSSSSNIIGQMLKLSSPRSMDELVKLYQVELRSAWQTVRDAARDKDAKIRDPKLARTHRELFGKESVLIYADKIDELLTDNEKRTFGPLREKVESLTKSKPSLAKAMSVDEGSVKLVAIHARGSHLSQLGSPLPRRIPTIFRDHELSDVNFPDDHSGRLELARWVIDPDNPLTARVMVNRIWQGHFGDGIVRTASNFGMKGDAPSNLKLLDWLAEDFVRGGWSIKRLHRQVVLSATYRMDSVSSPAGERIDPDNRLLWRQNRRRLEVEPFRDSLLAIGHELDRQLFGQAQLIYGDKFEETGAAKTIHDAFRRTVYLPINRAALEDFFSTFDYVDPAVSLEKRPSTTVPHQALFLMNHRLATHAAWRFADRLKQATDDAAQRIKLAFVIAIGRQPTADEFFTATNFVNTLGSAVAQENSRVETTNPNRLHEDPWFSFCRALLLTNEFIYVD